MDRESRNVASSSRAIRRKKKKECTQMFPVPSNLVESYQGVLSSKLTFRSDEYAKKWRVKVEKFSGQYFFTDGWKEFEEEVDVESRELLMYRTASSKRRALLGKKKEKRRKTNGNANDSTDSSFIPDKPSGVKKSLSFRREMKKHHQYRMGLPTIFTRSTGIDKRDEIKLKDIEGRVWPVRVKSRKSKASKTFALTRGWFDFLKGNNVAIGSTLSFSSSSTDTIVVKIVKEGSDKRALFKYLKNATELEGGHGNLNNASDHANVPTTRLSASDEEMESD